MVMARCSAGSAALLLSSTPKPYTPTLTNVRAEANTLAPTPAVVWVQSEQEVHGGWQRKQPDRLYFGTQTSVARTFDPLPKPAAGFDITVTDVPDASGAGASAKE